MRWLKLCSGLLLVSVAALVEAQDQPEPRPPEPTPQSRISDAVSAAEKALQEGNRPKALEYAQSALEDLKKWDGAKTYLDYSVLRALATAQLASDDFAAARQTAQEAADLYRVLYGEDSWYNFEARQLVIDVGLHEKLSADERDRLRAAHREFTRSEQLRLEGKASEALILA